MVCRTDKFVSILSALHKHSYLTNSGFVQKHPDLQLLLDEPKFSPQQVSQKYGLHPSKVRRIFLDEPGVIRIGHPATRTRKQYFTLRIPLSVVARVFGQMTVGHDEFRAPDPFKTGQVSGGRKR